MATTNTTSGIQILQAASYTRVFYFGTTAQTVAVNISKGGGTFAVAANSPATEISAGFYKILLTITDTSVLGDLAYNCTAASGGPATWTDQIVAQTFQQLQMNASGQVLIASNFKQGQPINGFPFTMTSASTGAPLTGLTVTAQRSLGGGFSPCNFSPTETANGDYVINLAGTDTNAPIIMLRFTAPGANDVNISLGTQP
jgi:hypothetical protein